jgi:hypothetical protein
MIEVLLVEIEGKEDVPPKNSTQHSIVYEGDKNVR